LTAPDAGSRGLARGGLDGWGYPLLLVALLVPGLDPMVRLLGGTVALALFVALTGAAVMLARRPEAARALNHALGGIPTSVLAGAAVALVLLLTAEPTSIAHSDRNHALTLAGQRLLAGLYPYGAPTFLGEPITPMPGGVVLALPFSGLFGNAGFQNALVLLVLLAVLTSNLRSRGLAHLAFVGVVVSPYVVYQIRWGEDLLANGAWVAVGALLVLHTWREHPVDWRGVGSALLLGVTLSWRPNMLVVLLPVVAHVLARHGMARALLLSVAILAGFLAVTLPFFLPDPARFSPIHVSSRLGPPGSLERFGLLAVVGGSALASGLVAWLEGRHREGYRLTLLAAAAAIGGQVLARFLANTVQMGHPSLGTLGYGVMASILLVFAATRLIEQGQRSAEPA
jgi:hypothetical protein